MEYAITPADPLLNRFFMLAYTALPDLIHPPTAAEVAVYVGGLLMVIVLPALFFSLTDRSNPEDKSE